MQKIHFYNRSQKSSKNLGFTIVELLVVIVVIGILAAITVVSFTGISQKATAVSLQSDLSGASTKLKMYQAEYGIYPTSATETQEGSGLYCPSPTDDKYCFKASPGNKLVYTNPSPQIFTLTAENNTTKYRITNDTSPVVAVDQTFAKAYGSNLGNDYGYSVVNTSDGGFAVAGGTYSVGAGSTDVYLAKYTSDGTLSWMKTWGGIGVDTGYYLIQTSDGGFALTGQTASSGAGGSDMFLAKFTSDGTKSWDKTWGGLATDYGYYVIQTSDGGYAVTGYSASVGAGSNDMILVKYASDGTLLWDQVWGGLATDFGYAVVQTNDNGLVVLGTTANYGFNGNDMFLAKYSSDGTFLWDKTWGGTGTDYGYSLTKTNDGGFAATGYTASLGNGGGNDMYIVKYDSSGNYLWARTWGGSSSDYGKSIIQTSDGGLAVTGRTNSFGSGTYDMFMVKYTSTGTFVWNGVFGGAGIDEGNAITQSIDGGFLITGITASYGTGTNNDILLVKYSSAGKMTNCSSPMCQDPSASKNNSPTLNETTSTLATKSDPSTITDGIPNFTANSVDLGLITSTTIVSP